MTRVRASKTTTTAKSGTVTEIHITIIGTED